MAAIDSKLRYSLYLLYWYKITNTDAQAAAAGFSILRACIQKRRARMTSPSPETEKKEKKYSTH
jgi:hypothetical protein